MPAKVKVQWIEGYALAIPYPTPNRSNGATHMIDTTTFATSRAIVIGYAVLEHYCRQDMCVAIDESWTLYRINREPELRAEVWKNLKAKGLMTVPCRIGPR